MTMAIGLDIGGTKIAGAAFDPDGKERDHVSVATPTNYGDFVDVCSDIVTQLETSCGKATTIGACAPFADEFANANTPVLIGKPLQRDLSTRLGRNVPFENDANCAALAEAREGAGQNYRNVFGLIMGTGIGGGFVSNGHVFSGANGICGEVGHLPLPYYEESDGERVHCGCGQLGCIEKLVAGPALARFYHSRTKKEADAKDIGEMARASEQEALRVLDAYYTVVAKAMVAILHMFDPDIITVSGGLNSLPGLYVAVPERWGRFAIKKKLVTQFVPAALGPMAGLRGAAILGIHYNE